MKLRHAFLQAGIKPEQFKKKQPISLKEILPYHVRRKIDAHPTPDFIVRLIQSCLANKWPFEAYLHQMDVSRVRQLRDVAWEFTKRYPQHHHVIVQLLHHINQELGEK